MFDDKITDKLLYFVEYFLFCSLLLLMVVVLLVIVSLASNFVNGGDYRQHLQA